MLATCKQCDNVMSFKYGDDEPDKFANRCVVCVTCREFIVVDDILAPILDKLVAKEDVIYSFLEWLENNSDYTIDRERVDEYLVESVNGE